MDLECVCIPLEVAGYTYTQWIGSLFGDCVYTPIEHISFFLGLLNIFCWMVAQLPQLYLNYSLGSAKALSKGLLIAWLLGDATNLIGCYLNQQLPTQKFTALYYVCIDTVTLTQFIYYHVCSPPSKTGGRNASCPPILPEAESCCCTGTAAAPDGDVQDDNLLCLRCSESSRLLTSHDGSSCQSYGSSDCSNSPSVRTHTCPDSGCPTGGQCPSRVTSATLSLCPARISHSPYASTLCAQPCAESLSGRAVYEGVSRSPGHAAVSSAVYPSSLAQVPDSDSDSDSNHSNQYNYASSRCSSRLILWLAAALCVGVCVYAGNRVNGAPRDVPPPFTGPSPTPHLTSVGSSADPPPCAPVVVVVPESWRVLGIWAAWISGLLYFSSRVFQLRADSRRRARGETAEGVSLSMFCITFVANLVYGVSVLLRTRVVDWQWFLATFPFLLGSLGTMCFDAALLRRGCRERACLREHGGS